MYPNSRQLPAVALASLMAVPAARAGDISGYWRTPVPHHRDSVVQIYKSGDVYDGKIVALEQPKYPGDNHPDLAGEPKMDIHNPDKSKQHRPLMGLEVVHGLKPDGGNQWDDASIYDPRNGKTYDAKATLSGDGNTLKLRGYVFISLLGKTQTWTRVSSPNVFNNHGPQSGTGGS